MYISDDAGRGWLDFLLKSKYERDLGVSQLYATEIRDHLKTGSFLEKGGVGVSFYNNFREMHLLSAEREREEREGERRVSEQASAQKL